jgi:hypothetical protein
VYTRTHTLAIFFLPPNFFFLTQTQAEAEARLRAQVAIAEKQALDEARAQEQRAASLRAAARAQVRQVCMFMSVGGWVGRLGLV